jgi:short-subunit dehydrogenase
LKAIITGASSGIGRELVRIVCRGGGNSVLGVGRDVDALNDLARELGDCIIPLQADLSKLSRVERVVEVASRMLGEVDLLVNNACFGLYKEIIDHSDEEALSMIMVKLQRPYY